MGFVDNAYKARQLLSKIPRDKLVKAAAKYGMKCENDDDMCWKLASVAVLKHKMAGMPEGCPETKAELPYNANFQAAMAAEDRAAAMLIIKCAGAYALVDDVKTPEEAYNHGCSEDIDFFSQEKWSKDFQPEVKIKFLDRNNVESSRTECYRREDLMKILKKPDSDYRAYYSNRTDRVLEPEGYGAIVSKTERFYKLPYPQAYITNRDVFDQGYATDYIAYPVYSMKRLGNNAAERGGFQYDIGATHGQSPGFTVFTIVPMNDSDTSLSKIYYELYKMKTGKEPSSTQLLELINKGLQERMEMIQSLDDEYPIPINELPRQQRPNVVPVAVPVVVPATDPIVEQPLGTLEGTFDDVLSVAWSPDSSKIASGESKDIQIWDAVSHQLLATLEGHSLGVISISWSPDSSKIVSGSEDNTVKIWDAVSHELLATLEGDIFSHIYSAVWSPDSSKIAAGNGKTVKIWDAVSHQLLSTMTGFLERVRTVAWSPDSSKIATGDDNDSVNIWDVESSQRLATFTGHSRSVGCIAWSPDSSKIATGSEDKTMKIWDVESHELLKTLKNSWGVLSVAWSPDSSRFMFSDDSVKIYDANSYQLLKAFGESISCVSWSPDSSKIVAGTFLGTLDIWSAEPVQSVEYVQSAEPVQSVEYVQSAEPVQSVEYVQSAEPVQSVESEHVELRSGFEVNGRTIGPDVDLGGADLADTDLTWADLENTLLISANLTNTNLTNADLTNTNLTNADLTGANLTNSHLVWANLTRANLTRANLTGAELEDANLTGTDLTWTDLANANFANANLTDSSIIGANLESTNLEGANLTGANFEDSTLTNVNLKNANLTNASLANIDFISTNLEGVNLEGADLTNAILTGANLTNANLESTNLEGANLTGANFEDSTLTNADLTWADLTNAILENSDLRANLTNADLTGANLTRSDFTGANLTGVRLTEADLTEADLTGANLTGANLTGANLTDITLYNTIVYTRAEYYSAMVELIGKYKLGGTLVDGDTTITFVDGQRVEPVQNRVEPAQNRVEPVQNRVARRLNFDDSDSSDDEDDLMIPDANFAVTHTYTHDAGIEKLEWLHNSPFISLVDYDASIKYFDSKNGALDDGSLMEDVTDMYWSPNRSYVAVEDVSGDLMMHSVSSDYMTTLEKYTLSTKDVYDLSWYHDSSMFVGLSLTDDETTIMSVYDTESGTLLQKIEFDIRYKKVAWSPDGNYIALLGVDGSMRLSTENITQVVTTIPPSRTSTNSMEWSPDSKMIVFGRVDIVDGWGVEEEYALWSLETEDGGDPHDGPVYLVKHSPDGNYLLSAGKNVRVWALTEAGPLLTNTLRYDEAPGTIGWSSDSKAFAVAAEKTLKVYG